MKRTVSLIAVSAIAGLFVAGCTANPETNRKLECGAGVVGGAAVGGLLGNQIGGGTGKDIATAVGAGAGAAAGTRLPACQ